MFTPVINEPCEICGWIFNSDFLNMVTLKDGLFFVCPDCCKKIVHIDGWRSMTCSEIKDVLNI